MYISKIKTQNLSAKNRSPLLFKEGVGGGYNSFLTTNKKGEV